MISKEEIQRASFKAKLDLTQIEKDYVLSWLLAGISMHPVLSTCWVFKGGTCLRKMYIENYRYSEDLDFTVSNASKTTINNFTTYINEVCQWVEKTSGIQMNTNRSIVESLHNQSDQTIFQGRIYYNGPSSPKSPRQWPRIKLDVTADEIIVSAPEFKKIIHPYSDQNVLNQYDVNTYSIYDVFSEKIRALFERTRPRDLYDVVEIKSHFPELNYELLNECLFKKCRFKKLGHLSIDHLKLDACKSGWEDQLSHQLPLLPNFQEYLNLFKNFFSENIMQY